MVTDRREITGSAHAEPVTNSVTKDGKTYPVSPTPEDRVMLSVQRAAASVEALIRQLELRVPEPPLSKRERAAELGLRVVKGGEDG